MKSLDFTAKLTWPSLIPSQHAHGAHRIPTARPASLGFQREAKSIRVEMIHRPSPVLMAPRFDDSDRFGGPFVGFDTGASQIVEASQDIVVPHGWKRKARPAAIDDLAGRQPPEHATLQQIFLRFQARVGNGDCGAPRTLVFQ